MSRCVFAALAVPTAFVFAFHYPLRSIPYTLSYA